MRTGIYLLLIFIIGCGKKNTEPDTVLAIKEMSELATVEYTVTKIIKANDNKTWFKIGDRKILMSCEAVIKAGIDLSKISKNNFSINGNEISVQLPAPVIISLSIPAEKIKVAYQEITLLREPYKTSERDALALQAENEIRKSIPALEILEQARVNTSLFVTNFLSRLGYKKISISYSDNKPLTKAP